MHHGSRGIIALPSATAIKEIIMPRRSRLVVPGCAHHVTQRGNNHATKDPLLDASMPLTTAVGNWSDWLSAEDVDSEIRAIRMATAHDLPYGEASFIERLELQFGRPLRPRKAGRKSKAILNETVGPKSVSLFES